MASLVMWIIAMGLILSIPKITAKVLHGLAESLMFTSKGIFKGIAMMCSGIVWILTSPIRFTVFIAKCVKRWIVIVSKEYETTRGASQKKKAFKTAMQNKNQRSSKVKIQADAFDAHFYEANALLKTLKVNHQNLMEVTAKTLMIRQQDAEMAIPTCVRKGIFQVDQHGQVHRDDNGNPIKVTISTMFEGAMQKAQQAKAQTESMQAKAQTESTQAKAQTESTQAKAQTESTQAKAQTESTQAKAQTESTQAKAQTESMQAKTQTESTQAKAHPEHSAASSDARKLFAEAKAKAKARTESTQAKAQSSASNGAELPPSEAYDAYTEQSETATEPKPLTKVGNINYQAMI